MKSGFYKAGLCTAFAFTLLGVNACSSDSSSGPNGGPEDIIGEENPQVSSALIEGEIPSSSSIVENLPQSSSSVIPGNQIPENPVNPNSPVNSSSSIKEEKPATNKEWPNLLGIHGGFYQNEVKLNPQGTLRCTFDGSLPTENTPEFNSERNISSNTVVRCISYSNGAPVDTATETFFIRENVNMPVVAVSVSPEFFSKNYIRSTSCEGSNPDYCPPGLMEDIEYPVHVEYFENGSSTQAKTWEINAGISLMGHWSRTYAKKSVSISMREQYQDGRLKYPLFATRPENKKFKAFVLRNNGNRFVSDYFEDAMATSLLEGSGVDYQRSRQVVVFYNGEYYGIHDMREKLNEHFVETNYGIDSKTVDIIKHVDDVITAGGGSSAEYEQMLQFIASNDFTGSENKNYEYIKSIMDVGNYADYMAAQIYYRNGDWPNNNVRAWRAPNQGWKFMVFDLDHGFGWDWAVSGFNSYYSADGASMFDWIRQGGKGGGSIFDSSPSPCSRNASAKCFHTIFVKLMQNDDFKRMFANHASVMYDHYLNNQNVMSAISAISKTLDPNEISRDMGKYPREKYGHGFDENGNSFVTWSSARDRAIWGEYQKEFGLSEPVSITISANGGGMVLMEGMKLPSSSYTGKFLGGNKMELTAVPTGSSVFSAWEDGSRENPRIVTITAGKTYSATFR